MRLASMRLGKSIWMKRDTKDKQWKLNPLVKQSDEPLLPRQSEARVLPLPPCCRERWGGKSVTNHSPYGTGCCTDRTLNSHSDWAELHVLYLDHRHDSGTARQLCPGQTFLPWGDTGITDGACGSARCWQQHRLGSCSCKNLSMYA